MNTLLEGPGRMDFYTNPSWVFRALGERQREFNWLITNLECNVQAPPSLRDDPVWISGADLTELVDSRPLNEPLQFVWGVLSGFRPGVLVDPAELKVYPYADGNDALWEPSVCIQHPLAELEIVCWDSSATLLLSRDDDVSRRFRAFFPEAVDLNEYNLARSAGDNVPRPVA